jgi:hypothetical protein
MKNLATCINLKLLNDSTIYTAVPEENISRSSTLWKSRIMTIHTYIPVKNCNIVQTEAEVAITSLNPSIANNQAVIFRVSRKKQTLVR